MFAGFKLEFVFLYHTPNPIQCVTVNHSISHSKAKIEKKVNLKLAADVPFFRLQKQPLRGVLRKKRSENMRKIYRIPPMPKCHFNKVAKQLY